MKFKHYKALLKVLNNILIKGYFVGPFNKYLNLFIF